MWPQILECVAVKRPPSHTCSMAYRYKLYRYEIEIACNCTERVRQERRRHRAGIAGHRAKPGHSQWSVAVPSASQTQRAERAEVRNRESV